MMKFQSIYRHMIYIAAVSAVEPSHPKGTSVISD